jgi:hypothetical protein
MKRILFLVIVVIPFLLISCETGNNGPEYEEYIPFDANTAIAIVKNIYIQWSDATANKDITTMYKLSKPGSNFEGMSNVCVEQWKTNPMYHFKFTNVSVMYINKDEATVDGIADFIQGPPNGGINGTHINYREKFRSGAVFVDGKWLLDGFNEYEFITSW